MSEEDAEDLLQASLDIWAVSGAAQAGIGIGLLDGGLTEPPPRQRPADPMDAFRETGIKVFTLDDLDVSEGIDTYHLAENYGILPGQTRTPEGRPMPMITLYPETGGAGIEDLERRTDERERAEQLRADQEARENAAWARRREELDLTAWAREVLDDPDTDVLDTETTGVHTEARIVEIGVQTVSGEVLVDTLIDPGEPIPAEATAIHGITDAMVAEAGAPTFGEVVDRLAAALTGKRVVIYNRGFDVGRLRYELARYYAGRVAGQDAQETVETGAVAAEEWDQAAMRAAAWIDGMRFEDAMDPNSTWVGEWSDYWGDYVWQPLPGGDHRRWGTAARSRRCCGGWHCGAGRRRRTWRGSRGSTAPCPFSGRGAVVVFAGVPNGDSALPEKSSVRLSHPSGCGTDGLVEVSHGGITIPSDLDHARGQV